MTRFLAALLLLGTSGSAVAGATPGPILQRMLDDAVAADPALPGVIVSISAPRRHLTWSGASTRAGMTPLAARTRFRIASITKVFTAATVLRLMEEGRLDLQAPIRRLIAEDTARSLTKGGYDPDAITVQQLLTHSSGLFDYASSAAFAEAVTADPRHRWTRSEQIDFAMTHGKSIGEPGERYGYSDTGYIILGEIIERVTGQPMPVAIATALRLRGLGLTDTYFETLEPAPGGATPIAPSFAGTRAMTATDPSFDLYGGGGLVSTVGDLTRFVRPLLQGRVFARRETLAVALAAPLVDHAPHETPHANLLVQTPVNGELCWGHGGYWGSAMIYCPASDIAIAITINQAEPGRPRTVLALAERLVAAVKAP